MGNIKNRNNLFITASGTDIGKTLITSAITRLISDKGGKILPLKPIISGFSLDKITDSHLLLKSADLPLNMLEKISPWRFEALFSPDIAARMENKELHLQEIIIYCQEMAKYNNIIVESIGGIMVPLNSRHTILDLAEQLNLPTILVVGSYLGSISHTLTAINVLQDRGVNISNIIISESLDSTVDLYKIVETIANFTNINIIIIPRLLEETKDYIYGDSQTPNAQWKILSKNLQQVISKSKIT